LSGSWLEAQGTRANFHLAISQQTPFHDLIEKQNLLSSSIILLNII